MQEDGAAGGPGREAAHGGGEGIRQVVIDDEAIDRQRLRGGDEIGEAEFAGAIFCMSEGETRNRAGHANAKAAALRLRGLKAPGFIQKHIAGRQHARHFAVIDGDGFVGRGQMHQHEAAAADIARARQGHRQREACRDRRIHRIAAPAQNIDADARGLHLLARHHAMGGQHRQIARIARDDGIFDRAAPRLREGVARQREARGACQQGAT